MNFNDQFMIFLNLFTMGYFKTNEKWFLVKLRWSEALGGPEFLEEVEELTGYRRKILGWLAGECGGGGEGFISGNLVLVEGICLIRFPSVVDRVAYGLGE